MVSIVFNILIFLSLFSNAFAQERFSPKSCLDASFKMKMIQKGPLFGLLKHEFIITKKDCIINVTHKKYLPKEWIIDICREPVHIKVLSATGVDVAKKENECQHQDKTRDTSDFCSQYFDLMDNIADDGLIFAEGDRDNLSSQHGQTFCTYLLLKKYLNESVVFSRYIDVPDIFLEKPATPAAKPLIKVPEDKVELKKEDQASTLFNKPSSSFNSVTETF